MSMRTLRANGPPRANACLFIYGTEAYNLNTRGCGKPPVGRPHPARQPASAVL